MPTRINWDDLDTEDNYQYFWNDIPYTGIAFELHGNGQLSVEQEFEGGWMAGLTKEYYPSGQLKMEGDGNGSVFEGIARYWHKNGQLKTEYYHNTKRGFYPYHKEWDEEGNLKSLEVVQLRLPNSGGHRVVTEFHSNGEIKDEKEFEFGYLIRHQTFNENGTETTKYFIVEDDKNYPSWQTKRTEYEAWKKEQMS